MLSGFSVSIKNSFKKTYNSRPLNKYPFLNTLNLMYTLASNRPNSVCRLQNHKYRFSQISKGFYSLSTYQLIISVRKFLRCISFLPQLIWRFSLKQLIPLYSLIYNRLYMIIKHFFKFKNICFLLRSLKFS